MANNLQIGETIYVPCSKVDELKNHPTSMYRTTVAGLNQRSATINLPGGNVATIGTSLLHRNVGIYIYSIGDFQTETTLINPLAKSILQFCRLIHEDDSNVMHSSIRSVSELVNLWTTSSNAYRYVIIIGHGSQEGINFGVDGWVTSEILHDELNIPGQDNKILISLCCQTGYKSFSAPLSRLNYCDYILAPFHSVHGAIASQFCQTFLSNHLQEGFTVKTAYNRTKESITGGNIFRLWRNEKLLGGMKK